MSLVKHSFGDGPTRSSSHLTGASDHSLIPLYIVAAHMSISRQSNQRIGLQAATCLEGPGMKQRHVISHHMHIYLSLSLTLPFHRPQRR